MINQPSYLREMMGNLDAAILFAERHDDHILAAKIEELRHLILDRLFAAPQG